MPVEAQQAHDLLVLCQSLKHLRWISPDGHPDSDLDDPRVTLPNLESLHVRHSGLTLLIKAPKLELAVWDVHGKYVHMDLIRLEETHGLHQNLPTIRALTVCPCIFPYLSDLLWDSACLEIITLCPSDLWDRWPFRTLMTILAEANDPLRRVIIPVSSRFLDSCMDLRHAERLCKMIALRPDVSVECRVFGPFNNRATRIAFEHIAHEHPSQFTLITDLDREQVYEQLGCDWCPNYWESHDLF
jgi:hypothetical protein